MHTDYSGGKFISIYGDTISPPIRQDVYFEIVTPTYWRFFHPFLDKPITISFAKKTIQTPLAVHSFAVPLTESIIASTLLGFFAYVDSDNSISLDYVRTVIAEVMVLFSTLKTPVPSAPNGVRSIVSIPEQNIYVGYYYPISSIDGACYILQDGRYIPWMYVIPVKDGADK